MSSMDDLITWLRARLDEDEVRAQELLAHAQQTSLTLKDPKLPGPLIPGWHDWPNVERMYAKRLAEVEAKRRILDEHDMWATDDSDDHEHTQSAFERSAALGVAVRLLALPYADQPGYREEWRPDM